MSKNLISTIIQGFLGSSPLPLRQWWYQ